MSQFLPEPGPGSPQTDSVGSLLTPATLDISSGDIALMQKVLSAASRNPNLIPSDFMAYLVDYIQTSRLSIPIGQVFGYTQVAPKVAGRITTQEITSSATYVDLTTAGPQLVGLPDGNYLIVYGSGMFASPTATAGVSLSLNGSTPVDADGTFSSVSNGTYLWPTFALSKRLSNNGSNSIKMQYKSDGANNSQFLQRWMFAIKTANL